jgi:replicative DNA helicase
MADESILKVPPQSIEAEQSVIGALLIDKEAVFKIIESIRPEDFYREEHRLIISAVFKLALSEKPVDIVSVAEELKNINKLEFAGGISYLAQLAASVPNAANSEYYAKVVKSKSLMRQLIQAGAEISELGFNEAMDIDTLIDIAEQKIFSISQKKSKSYFVQVKDFLGESFSEIEKRYKQRLGIAGLPSGFPSLDKITGGFQRSDLIVIAARPSIGKTSLAVNISENIAIKERKSVAFFSLEMSKEQLIERMLCSLAKVDMQRLKTGYLRDEDWTKLTEAYGSLYEAPIYIDDSPDASLVDIRAKSRRLKIETNIELIIIDYLQLVRMEQRVENRVIEISQITRGLKNLARELGLPIVILSQLSRAVDRRDDKRPILSDLRESGCLTGDTILIRGDTGEFIPLKELIDNKFKLPIPVLSLDNNLKVQSANLINAFSSGVKTTYLLKTQSGREIKASGNHPFLTVDGWKRLDQLEINENIAVPRIIKIQGERLYTDEEIIFFAHMVGSGCYVPGQPIHYKSSDIDNIKIVEDTSRRLFNISTRLARQENWYHLYLPSPYKLTWNKHHPFVNWLKKNGLNLARSYEKKLPDGFLRMTESQIAIFLKHLWSTDGNISLVKNMKRGNSVSIYYPSTSRVLIEQVQYLLLRLGILSTIRSSRKQNYKTNWILEIQGEEEQLRFIKTIGCFGKRGEIIPDLIRLLEDVRANPNNDIVPKEVWNFVKNEKDKEEISWRGLSRVLEVSYSGSSIFNNNTGGERLKRYAQVLKSEKLMSFANSDIYWDKVIEIKKLGEEEVFDVTIEGTHNFVANNIFVHNSIEQDADVVMFLHRPDENNRNEIELSVAKQRNGPTDTLKLLFLSEFTRFVESIDEKKISKFS